MLDTVSFTTTSLNKLKVVFQEDESFFKSCEKPQSNHTSDVFLERMQLCDTEG